MICRMRGEGKRGRRRRRRLFVFFALVWGSLEGQTLSLCLLMALPDSRGKGAQTLIDFEAFCCALAAHVLLQPAFLLFDYYTTLFLPPSCQMCTKLTCCKLQYSVQVLCM